MKYENINGLIKDLNDLSSKKNLWEIDNKYNPVVTPGVEPSSTHVKLPLTKEISPELFTNGNDLLRVLEVVPHQCKMDFIEKFCKDDGEKLRELIQSKEQFDKLWEYGAYTKGFRDQIILALGPQHLMKNLIKDQNTLREVLRDHPKITFVKNSIYDSQVRYPNPADYPEPKIENYKGNIAKYKADKEEQKKYAEEARDQRIESQRTIREFAKYMSPEQKKELLPTTDKSISDERWPFLSQELKRGYDRSHGIRGGINRAVTKSATFFKELKEDVSHFIQENKNKLRR